MKFTYKVFFCTITVIAVAMGFGGLYLINSLFSVAVTRETRQALDENSMLCFALETIALNVPLKYERLQDKTIEEIASTLNTGRYIRISDEYMREIYSGADFSADGSLLDEITENTQACQVIKYNERYFVHTATNVKVIDRSLYLETFKDISTIFQDRETGFAIYRNVTIISLLGGAVMMSLISLWLTRPIKMLSGAARGMSVGNYSVRAKRVSDDEIGQLTNDFNVMAASLESTILELHEAAESRERFVADFAHELKTPLTAIIGYADILRSMKVDEEKRFLSANYIYSEGRRLEKLSFRLLDIIVLKKIELNVKSTHVSDIFKFISDTFQSEQNIVLSVSYDDADINIEMSLITTVLNNIIENAVKASGSDGRIEVSGLALADGYRFSVRDYGCGIAEDEIDKLTQAFYMVDKSRSRSKHGAGLGLTLCDEILSLHGSHLEFESTLGEGTTASFEIKNILN